MNLLLFADDVVGLEVLDFLLGDYPDDLQLVVTTSENEIFQRCIGAGIPVSVFESSASIHASISTSGITADLGVLAWWPHILREPLLSITTRGFINFHPSLLPYNRGKHYNFWALVEGAPFGVSLHIVNEGIDTGDIIAQRAIPYDWTDNGESLYNKARKAIVALFRDSYPSLREAGLEAHPQNLALGSSHHSGELEKASRLDLDRFYRARDLINLLRARTFSGHPACWFEDNDGQCYEIRINIKRKE